MKNVDYYCPRCSVSYVLFKKETLCPNCRYKSEEIAHEHFKFIPTVLRNMKLNKRKYGTYGGNILLITSTPEYIQKLCFDIFDHLENIRPDDPSEYMRRTLDKMSWQNNLYLKIHTRDILSDLYAIYAVNKPKHSLFSKIKHILS